MKKLVFLFLMISSNLLGIDSLKIVLPEYAIIYRQGSFGDYEISEFSNEIIILPNSQTVDFFIEYDEELQWISFNSSDRITDTDKLYSIIEIKKENEYVSVVYWNYLNKMYYHSPDISKLSAEINLFEDFKKYIHEEKN